LYGTVAGKQDQKVRRKIARKWHGEPYSIPV